MSSSGPSSAARYLRRRPFWSCTLFTPKPISRQRRANSHLLNAPASSGFGTRAHRASVTSVGNLWDRPDRRLAGGRGVWVVLLIPEDRPLGPGGVVHCWGQQQPGIRTRPTVVRVGRHHRAVHLVGFKAKGESELLSTTHPTWTSSQATHRRQNRCGGTRWVPMDRP